MTSLSIPGYEILDTLGKGGMATVYLARQAIFERKVALKVMSKSLADNPAFGQRFLREARIVSELVHPNIVAVYQVGVHEDMYYLAMEYLPGQELKQLITTLSIPEKITIIRDIASALGFAGARGYVHRDIKPENIMYDRESKRAVLTDFGIARAADLDADVTHTGITVGTPHYMSPEQAKGGVVDQRSDLYSLGAVMYTLLTGEVPYTAESAVAIGIKHITSPVPLLPEELESLQPIIDRLLAKAPEDRYQDASQLIKHLDGIDLNWLENLQLDYPQLDGSGMMEDATTEIFRVFDSAELGVAQARPGRSLLASVVYLVLLLLGIIALIGYALETHRIHDWFRSAQDISLPVSPSASAPATIPDSGEKEPDISAQSLESASQEEPQNQVSSEADASQLRASITELEAAFSRGETTLDEIVAVYRQLRVLEPANQSVQDSLERLHQQSLVRVNELMAAGELDYAAKLLDDVRRLFPSINIDNVPDTLSPTVPDIAQLQQQADLLMKQGNDVEPPGNNALTLYRQILALDDANNHAQDALIAIEANLVKRGYQYLKVGDITAAEVMAHKALSINADSKASIGLLDEIGAQFKRKQQRDQLLAEAEQQMANGLLFYPPGESAYDLFYRVLQTDPDNERANAGQALLVEALSSQVWHLVEEGQLEEARRVLRRPLSIWPDNQRVRSLADAVDAVAEQ